MVFIPALRQTGDRTGWRFREAANRIGKKLPWATNALEVEAADR
jgi:hypothetical protein